jgi:hypothetical protein
MSTSRVLELMSRRRCGLRFSLLPARFLAPRASGCDACARAAATPDSIPECLPSLDDVGLEAWAEDRWVTVGSAPSVDGTTATEETPGYVVT